MPTPVEAGTPVPPRSRSATWAAILGGLSVLGWVLTGIPAIILGLVALRGGGSGRRRAWFGILSGTFFTVVYALVFSGSHHEHDHVGVTALVAPATPSPATALPATKPTVVAAPQQPVATSATEASDPQRDTCGASGTFSVCVDRAVFKTTVEDGLGSGLRIGKGSHFVLIDVTVSHSGKKAEDISSGDFLLVDADKNEYSPEPNLLMTMAGGQYQPLVFEQVNPRQAVGGWIGYSVPEDAKDVHLVAKLDWHSVALALPTKPASRAVVRGKQ